MLVATSIGAGSALVRPVARQGGGGRRRQSKGMSPLGRLTAHAPHLCRADRNRRSRHLWPKPQGTVKAGPSRRPSCSTFRPFHLHPLPLPARPCQTKQVDRVFHTAPPRCQGMIPKLTSRTLRVPLTGPVTLCL